MLSENLLIAIYISHFPVFSYKNLRLGGESLMLLEYHKKWELSGYIKESKGYKKIMFDFPLDGSVGPADL